MYRVIVQPLTEKTEMKPISNEVLINTENAHLNICDSNGNLKSATKDIELNQFFLTEENKRLLELYDSIINDSIFSNSGIVGAYNESISLLASATKLKNDIENNTLSATIFETKLTEMKNIYKKILEFKENNYYLINYYRSTFKEFDEIESLIEELKYIVSCAEEVKQEVNNLTSNLKSIQEQVKNNIDSRVSQSEYETYMNNLKNKYLNLKNSYSHVSSVKVNR